jgi:hypothetical protein
VRRKAEGEGREPDMAYIEELIEKAKVKAAELAHEEGS